VQTKLLLAALLLGVTPALLANDVLDMDARAELGRDLLFRAADDIAAFVQAELSDDRAAAIVRLEFSRNQGAAYAAQQLGYAYLAARYEIAPNSEKASRNYELAVAQELPIALWEYGMLLFGGKHFPKDVDRGLTLINRAAELHFPAAIAFLVSQLRDSGDEKDAAIAEAWYESLGMFDTEVALGIEGDPLQRAQQYAYGQADLYAMHREGVILEENQALADVWLENIASEHIAIALDSVAILLSSRTDMRSDQHLAASIQEVALSFDDSDPTVVNNHAWLLATASSADLRDGAKAVRLMQNLFDQIEAQGFMIDTMAAAYAEAGNFDAAIAEQQRANAWYEAESQDFPVGVEHMESYVEGRAWRE
jgi:hypothetical protein